MTFHFMVKQNDKFDFAIFHRYGNMGCQVSKGEIQSQMDFWPKINIQATKKSWQSQKTYTGGPPLVRSPLVRIPLVRILVLQVQNLYQWNLLLVNQLNSVYVLLNQCEFPILCWAKNLSNFVSLPWKLEQPSTLFKDSSLSQFFFPGLFSLFLIHT